MSEFPIESPETQDIYSFGFDKGMNRTFKSIHSQTVYDQMQDSINANQIFTGGNLNAKTLTIAGFTRMVAPGDDIQAALDSLNREGGGTLQMKSGVYKVTSPLIGYSSVSIEGVSAQATVIDFVGSTGYLSFSSTKSYSTGTITSIASSVVVTGSGTAWLANVMPGQQLFLGTRWYKIASVITDTQLILAEGYGDNVTLPATYRIATICDNVSLSNITLQNSSGTALTFFDSRRATLRNVYTLTSNIGATFTNCSEIDANRVLAITNVSDGIRLTNVGLFNWSSINTPANGANGIKFSNVKSGSLFACASDGNAGDGFNLTEAVDTAFLAEANGNGGQGYELVSDCDSVVIYSASASFNTSDGIRLTATSDNVKIYGNKITFNGGFGMNIAASSCDNTIIAVNSFASNSSGAASDSGTGTVVRGNSGLADSGGSFGSGVSTLAAGTYTPTLTNVANLDSSAVGEFQYSRVGATIMVSGAVGVNPTTTATSTQLGISLPVASAFTVTDDCAGTAFCPTIAAQGAAILADVTNDRAQMQWVAADVTSQSMYITFTYQVI